MSSSGSAPTSDTAAFPPRRAAVVPGFLHSRAVLVARLEALVFFLAAAPFDVFVMVSALVDEAVWCTVPGGRKRIAMSPPPLYPSSSDPSGGGAAAGGAALVGCRRRGKPISDAELLRVIDSEIKCAEERDDHDREAIPENFPFEIHDEEKMSVITLKRDCKAEKIEIVVSMLNAEIQEGTEYDDEDSEEGDNPEDSSVSLIVTISKGSSSSLKFSKQTCKWMRKLKDFIKQ